MAAIIEESVKVGLTEQHLCARHKCHLNYFHKLLRVLCDTAFTGEGMMTWQGYDWPRPPDTHDHSWGYCFFKPVGTQSGTVPTTFQTHPFKHACVLFRSLAVLCPLSNEDTTHKVGYTAWRGGAIQSLTLSVIPALCNVAFVWCTHPLTEKLNFESFERSFRHKSRT